MERGPIPWGGSTSSPRTSGRQPQGAFYGQPQSFAPSVTYYGRQTEPVRPGTIFNPSSDSPNAEGGVFLGNPAGRLMLRKLAELAPTNRSTELGGLGPMLRPIHNAAAYDEVLPSAVKVDDYLLSKL